VDWLHNGTRPHPDDAPLWPEREKERIAINTVIGERSTLSRLIVAWVRFEDAGNWTCKPRGLNPGFDVRKKAHYKKG